MENIRCYVEDDPDIICVEMQLEYIDGEESLIVKDVKNWDVWDSITIFEEALDKFGDTYWDTLDDYKSDNGKSLSEWYAENRQFDNEEDLYGGDDE